MTGSGDTLQSVARALSLLDDIASAPASSARQLADRQGLRLATTYHLLKTLEVGGYVLKVDRGYGLGPRIGMLAQALERDLQPDPRALGVMRRLVESVGDTAYLSRWKQGDVVITAVAEGRHPVRVSGVHVGLRGHAYARASGKVLLAFGPPERLTGYLAVTELEQLTPHTPATPDAVVAEIDRTRARGVAFDEEEFTPGVCCISVPIDPQWRGRCQSGTHGEPSDIPLPECTRPGGRRTQDRGPRARRARFGSAKGVTPAASRTVKEAVLSKGG